MTRLKTGTWVVVADGEKALFLVNRGDEAAPMLEVIRELEHDNPPSREQGADRPGRFPDTGTASHRSAVEETDWHRLEKERFADELADRMYKAAHRNAFEGIVIAAPPLVLGEIRKKLHKEVAARVVAEHDKELTNHKVEDIERLLAS